MDSKKLLFVLRHGERADRAPGYRQPKTMLPHDPPLTTLGVRQAEASATRIQRLVPRDFSVHIVSSPFYRCLMTAAELAKRFSVPVHVQEGFGEWLYAGDFTESPMDNLSCVVAPESLEKELGVPVIVTPSLARAHYPESLSSMRTRVRSVYNRYLPQVPEPVLIVVTHMSLVNTVTEIWAGHSCDFSEDYYCILSHAEMTGSRYTLKVEGAYDHAPQDG